VGDAVTLVSTGQVVFPVCIVSLPAIEILVGVVSSNGKQKAVVISGNHLGGDGDVEEMTAMALAWALAAIIAVAASVQIVAVDVPATAA
jgi:hypothetical protein